MKLGIAAAIGQLTNREWFMTLRLLSGIVAATLGTFAAAGQAAWVTYRSPSGFYSVDHPSDWKVVRDGNAVNISPDDDSGAVTISAYLGKTAPGLAEELISGTFTTEQPTSQLLKVSGSGWKGVRRTFIDKSHAPSREWAAVVAMNAYGTVMVTSNEVSSKIAERGAVYTRILQSLQLSTPKR
jgi:hypothetical protein